MHADVASYDPIWTAANIAGIHGALVYDTLFGIDHEGLPKPQMVEKFGPSDDKKTWTFQLRDGLRWHDGTAVTSADVVPSIRRWAARSSPGQLMMQRVVDISAKDERTFAFTLKEPFGALLNLMVATTLPQCFIMRKREAETDPYQKIDQYVGSGPFVFNTGETRVGAQYVYDRNPNYLPRPEPPSGMTGGKVAKVDRVTLLNMPDAQTAVAALQTDEIDFYEIPPIDLLPQLEADPHIVIETLYELGLVGLIRLNHLHPPFNNVKIRQAMLWLVKQEDMLRPTFSDPRFYHGCGSFFTCGSAMENDANMEWFTKGPDLAKARALLKEGGYDGRPVVVLQATSVAYMFNAATVLAQAMRAAGFNVDLEAMDWAAVVNRRSNKGAPEAGGWDIFITSGSGASYTNPVIDVAMAENGQDAWFGWPNNPRHEELRLKWINAETLEERKAIARLDQEEAWNFVPHMYFGKWEQPTAHRKNVTGWLHMPDIIPFWNVAKT
jgi:peptide/nickel transport system substrate-binding protein